MNSKEANIYFPGPVGGPCLKQRSIYFNRKVLKKIILKLKFTPEIQMKILSIYL